MSGRPNEIPLFVLWYRFADWFLDVTDNFPKKARFTFTTRLDGLVLAVLEGIVEAQYTRQKSAKLKEINLKLERLRILLRLCHGKRYLSGSAYERSATEINEAGRMVGGWIKEQAGR